MTWHHPILARKQFIGVVSLNLSRMDIGPSIFPIPSSNYCRTIEIVHDAESDSKDTYYTYSFELFVQDSLVHCQKPFSDPRRPSLNNFIEEQFSEPLSCHYPLYPWPSAAQSHDSSLISTITWSGTDGLCSYHSSMIFMCSISGIKREISQINKFRLHLQNIPFIIVLTVHITANINWQSTCTLDSTHTPRDMCNCHY